MRCAVLLGFLALIACAASATYEYVPESYAEDVSLLRVARAARRGSNSNSNAEAKVNSEVGGAGHHGGSKGTATGTASGSGEFSESNVSANSDSFIKDGVAGSSSSASAHSVSSSGGGHKGHF